MIVSSSRYYPDPPFQWMILCCWSQTYKQHSSSGYLRWRSLFIVIELLKKLNRWQETYVYKKRGKKNIAYGRPIPELCGFCCHLIIAHKTFTFSISLRLWVVGVGITYVEVFCVFYWGSFYCEAAGQKGLSSNVFYIVSTWSLLQPSLVKRCTQHTWLKSQHQLSLRAWIFNQVSDIFP